MALPVLTPGVETVGRMGKKWNRRETKRVPAASGCGQMLGEGSGRKENGRRCRRMKMRICIASRGQSEKVVLEVELSKMVVARANARASFSST